MRKRVVIITDCVDMAYNELRGVILSNLAASNCVFDVEIEPVISVEPFSVVNGNFILRLMAEAYPPETIFSIILNPIKTRPERIFGRTKDKKFVFIGANTGVFTWFLKDFGIDVLYELNDPGFSPFGGKYVHAPNVAKLAMGMPFEEMGKVFNPDKLLNIELEQGTIVHTDNFGLIKFIGTLPKSEDGNKFEIEAGNKKFIATYSKRMMNLETGEWAIYPGSSLGLPELGMVRDNGVRKLGLKIGDKIVFNKL